MKEIVITEIKGKYGRATSYEIMAFDMSKKDTLIDSCKTLRNDDVQGIIHYMTVKYDIDESKTIYESY